MKNYQFKSPVFPQEHEFKAWCDTATSPESGLLSIG